MAQPSVRKYNFLPNQDVLYLKEFPIAKLPSHQCTLSLYGVVRQDDRIVLQTDFSNFLVRGREGIKQPDGRFVWPFIAIQWIPEEERKQFEEFCFVYNLYGEDDSFMGHRRCHSTFMLARTEK